MLVSKWGNSLAVRLPKALVDELGLAPGDELKVVEASKRRIAVEKADRRAEFLKRWSSFAGPLPRTTGSTVTRPTSGDAVSTSTFSSMPFLDVATRERRARGWHPAGSSARRC